MFSVGDKAEVLSLDGGAMNGFFVGDKVTVVDINNKYSRNKVRVERDGPMPYGGGWTEHRHLKKIEGGTMKKSDLKTGMWVVNKSGEKGMVLLGTSNGDIISGSDLWMPLDSYNEDLTTMYASEIIEVWQPETNRNFFNFNKEEWAKLLWKCPFPRALTTSEAEEILKAHLGQDVIIKAV